MKYQYNQKFKDTEKLLRFIINHEFEEYEVLNIANLYNYDYKLEFDVLKDNGCLFYYSYTLWSRDEGNWWSCDGCIEEIDRFPKNIRWSMVRVLNKWIRKNPKVKFKCKYCKNISSADDWNLRTIQECGNIDKGIKEGYKDTNFYYICPICNQKSYKKDWIDNFGGKLK